MGWFTQCRLNNLQNLLNEVQNQQNCLLHVQAIQMQQMDEIDAAAKQLYKALQSGHTAWISYSSLDHARSQLWFNLQKLTRALQAAQHGRLSIDLLPSHKLKKLFDAAARKASAHHHQLLLRHPSDLLQIETSYLHDGHDVHLILHIPMAPLDSLLRVFQLRPFLLPFMTTHMLLPSPAHQILAISANSDWLSVELSAVHLLGCHQVNQVYICEQSGVLKRYLNYTCLGSLYMQDLQGATTLFEMDIIPEAETVLQLNDNWYIVHSPVPLTSRIDCLNSSVSEFFIKRGANRIHVSPSCHLHLTSHVLISNFAIQLDTIIKHYEWDLRRISFLADELAHSDNWLSTLEKNAGKATFNTIRHSLAVEPRSTIWSYIFGLLGLVIAVTLTVLLGSAFLTRHFLTLCQCVTQWVTALLPALVRALMQPPPPQEAAAWKPSLISLWQFRHLKNQIDLSLFLASKTFCNHKVLCGEALW
jgi:hypothetical protein